MKCYETLNTQYSTPLPVPRSSFFILRPLPYLGDVQLSRVKVN